MATYGSAKYGGSSYGTTDLGSVTITSDSTISAELKGKVLLGAVTVSSASSIVATLSTDADPPYVLAPETQPTLTIELGLESGTGWFTLDDPTLGQLNTNILGDDLGFVWTDVTDWVLEKDKLAFRRGATRSQGPYFRTQAGRLTVKFRNLDGRFDPDNLSGPYVVGEVSALKPDVWVRVRATINGLVEDQFIGRVDAWTPTYPSAGKVSFVEMVAEDAVAPLSAGDPITSTAPAGDTIPARVGRILDQVDWPADMRDIGSDDDWVTCISTELTGPAWRQMTTAADSGIGYLFVNRHGSVVYRSHAAFPRAVQVSFGPRDTEGVIPFRDPVVSHDSRQTFDTVKLTREGGSEQALEDLDARAANGGVMRTHTATGLLAETNAQVTRVAAHILSQHRDLVPHVEQFSVRLTDVSPNWQWVQMLRLDLLNHVDVTYDTPDGRTVTRAGLVRGLALAKARNEWTWTISMVRAPEPGGDFTLDDAALGVLDVGRLAAF